MLHGQDVLPRNQKVGFYVGGVVNWRTWLVDRAAKVAGLCVKIEGMPLGTARNLDRESVCCGEAGSSVYPSRFAMEAAVDLEIHADLGRVQTQTVAKVIQRAIDKALRAHGVDPSMAAVAD